MINAIRLAKVAKDNNIAGVINDVCPFLFKSPKEGTTESTALFLFKKFVDTYAISS